MTTTNTDASVLPQSMSGLLFFAAKAAEKCKAQGWTPNSTVWLLDGDPCKDTAYGANFSLAGAVLAELGVKPEQCWSKFTEKNSVLQHAVATLDMVHCALCVQASVNAKQYALRVASQIWDYTQSVDVFDIPRGTPRMEEDFTAYIEDIRRLARVYKTMGG